MTRIAIDAMGGDHAPEEIVKGAVWAALDYNIQLSLLVKKMKSKENLIKSKNQV